MGIRVFLSLCDTVRKRHEVLRASTSGPRHPRGSPEQRPTLLPSAWPTDGCCGLLESELAGRRYLSLTLPFRENQHRNTRRRKPEQHRHRKRNLPSAVSVPKCPQKLGLSQAKPGSRNSIRVSVWVAGNYELELSSAAAQGH